MKTARILIRNRLLRFFALAVFLGSAAFQLRHAVLKDSIKNNSQKPWNIFFTEMAMHYYFTDQIYQHGANAFEKLTKDERVLYPETINDWKTFSIGMEFLPAALARLKLVPNLTEAIFLSSNLYFSLKFVLLFWLLTLICRSLLLSFIISLVALVSPYSYTRSVIGVFLREDFSLLFILLSIIFFIKVHSNNSRIFAILAALNVIIALNTWYLAAFLYLPILFIAIWMYLEQQIFFPWRNFLLAVILVFTGCVLFPLTRHNAVYFSPCMIFTILCLFLFGPLPGVAAFRKRRFIAVTAMLAVALLAGNLLSAGDLNHVFSITWEKIRQGGIKPRDPNELSFLTRLYWQGDFLAPNVNEWLQDTGYFLLLWIVIFGYAIFHRLKSQRGSWTPVIMILAGIALSINGRRNLVIAILMFSVASAFALRYYWPLLHRRFQMTLGGLSLGLLFLLPWTEKAVTMGATYARHMDRTVEWLSKNSDAQTVVVGHFSELPGLLAFSKVKVTSHSKFESVSVRQRVADYYDAIYAPLPAMQKYMKNVKANLLMLSLDYFGFNRRYEGAMLNPEGTALLHLATMTDHDVTDPHFKLVLNLTPEFGYAFFSFAENPQAKTAISSVKKGIGLKSH